MSAKENVAPQRPQKTKFGQELVDSARQILAHMRGEIELPTRRITVPDPTPRPSTSP